MYNPAMWYPFKDSVNSCPLPPAPAADLAIPSTQRVSLFELGPWHCRYPLGDGPNFQFCGVSGLPVARTATSTMGVVSGG
jgi:hypothetical protein